MTESENDWIAAAAKEVSKDAIKRLNNGAWLFDLDDAEMIIAKFFTAQLAAANAEIARLKKELYDKSIELARQDGTVDGLTARNAELEAENERLKGQE